MAKLNGEDWEQLDRLLVKIGFGGYYNLVECLKIVGREIHPNLNGNDKWSGEDDLHTIVLVLLRMEKGEIKDNKEAEK